MITRFIVLQNSISSLLNGGIEARVKMYESRRIDFEFDSKGQDSQFDSRSNLTFDRIESFKSSSNAISIQFFFFFFFFSFEINANGESISKNIEEKKTMIRRSSMEDSRRIAKECDNIIAEMRACAPVVLAIYSRIRLR